MQCVCVCVCVCARVRVCVCVCVRNVLLRPWGQCACWVSPCVLMELKGIGGCAKEKCGTVLINYSYQSRSHIYLIQGHGWKDETRY